MRAKWQVNMQQSVWEEVWGTMGWGGEVTEWVLLLLAWPFRVGGIQRVGEALRVSFPGGRNGLSKGQEMRRLQQRAGVGGEGTAMHAQLKVPPSSLLQGSQDLYQVDASI